MANTVQVSGIAQSTPEKEVRDFFSFCGRITSLELKSDPAAPNATQAATVTFEKETAAKTALLLDNTQLGPSQVHVTSGAGSGSGTGTSQPAATAAGNEEDLPQEAKPRSRIFAEYLAHGYTLSDSTIEKAIALDNKHGFSNKFVSTLKTFDDKYHATDTAKNLDTKLGVTDKANQGWLGLNSYFEQAVNTPTGQKLHTFYLQGDKQVRDIHNEARRLADLKAGKHTPEKVEGTDKTVCNCGSEAGKCGCAPGTCACKNCAKSSSSSVAEVEKAKTGKYPPEKVQGTDKTVCNCSAEEGQCGCAPGACACKDCGKASSEAVAEVEEKRHATST